MSESTLVRSTRLPRRLMDHMQWVAILSDNEARSAIVAQRQGDTIRGGSEAVVHYGGAAAVIRAAIRTRHRHNQLQKGPRT